MKKTQVFDVKKLGDHCYIRGKIGETRFLPTYRNDNSNSFTSNTLVFPVTLYTVNKISIKTITLQYSRYLRFCW